MVEAPRPKLSVEGLPSQHPKLRVQLSEADLDAPSGCQLLVYVQLPPALFLNTYELPPHRPLPSLKQDGTQAVVSKATLLGKQELEKAVGWTDAQGSRRKVLSKRSPKRTSSRHSFALSNEHTVGVFQLALRDPPGSHEYNFKDAIDSILVEHGPNGSPEPGKRRKKEKTAEDLARVHTIDIPIHARYLPPVTGSPLLDFKDLGQILIDPSKGHYEDVQVPSPKLVYSCQGEPTAQEAFKFGWEYVQPNTILQKDWAHFQHSLGLPTSNDARKHRLLTPFALDGEEPLPSSFTVPLPQGDASITTLVQLSTAAFLLLSAFYVLFSVRQTVAKVERSEQALRKLAETKSQ